MEHPNRLRWSKWALYGALGLLLAIYAVVLIRTAWVGDDAFISFRVIYNFLHGYGLRYNVAERVQVFTHPLWLFVLIPFQWMTGEAYLSTLGVSMAVSLCAVGLLAFGTARALPHAILGVFVLVLSRAFMDYSTSGLENPLNHLLLACFALVYFRVPSPRRLLWLSLIAALGVTNRMDTLLLYAPALALAFFEARSLRSLGLVAVGFAPFALWELFSLFYFGFPFPNTAYAKLGAGLPASEVLAQGGWYFVDSLRKDPLTLTVCACGCVLPILTRQWRLAILAAGIPLYLVYVLKVGGDFMSGRFFSAPFMLAALILTRIPMPGPARRWIPAFGLAAVLAFVTPFPTVLTGSNYALTEAECGNAFVHGIMDSRRTHYQATGLLCMGKQSTIHVARSKVRNLSSKEPVPTMAAGLDPYFAGPGVYYLDLMCLADPLRARLPHRRTTGWRPGHIFRAIPKGYSETLHTGANRLDDRRLAEYYDHLGEIIRGPLFSRHRLKTIVLMNAGLYDALLNYDAWRDPAPLGAAKDISGRPLQELPPKSDTAHGEERPLTQDQKERTIQ